MSMTEALQAPENSERRRSGRHVLAEPFNLTASASGRTYVCSIEDISLDGVKLRFLGPVPQSSVIALEHPLAGTLCGICVWRDSGTIGVELELPRSELERVLKCICLVL